MRVVTINIWPSEGGTFWFWDTAEDSGGHDRLVPTGPFPSRPLCIKDVRDAFLDTGERIVLQEGKPERYVAESLFQGGR
jgi:hypothetical protein